MFFVKAFLSMAEIDVAAWVAQMAPKLLKSVPESCFFIS